jgi:hypothetical protein
VQQQLQQLCGWLQPQLGQLQLYWLLVLVKAAQELGLKVEPGFEQALSVAAEQLGEQLTPQERAAVERQLQRLKQGGGSSSSAPSSSEAEVS